MVFFWGLALMAMGQNSARATMQVSVTIVPGVSVENVGPSRVILSREGISKLAKIRVKGAGQGQTSITVSRDLSLKDSNGNEISMDVSNNIQEEGNNVTDISFQALPKQGMQAGTYRGELTTTIEYL